MTTEILEKEKMKPTRPWAIEDVLDLEFFFERDRSMSDSELKKRDRDIAGQLELPETVTHPGEMSVKNRRDLMLAWVFARRNSHGKNRSVAPLLPGDIYSQARYWINVIALVSSFIGGISVCATFFTYTGAEPLNVAWFLSITVGVQLMFLMGMPVVFLVYRRRSSSWPFFPYGLAGMVFGRIVSWIYEKQAGIISGEVRIGLERTLGVLRSRKTVYGLMFFWPLFTLVQLAGIGFNIGILLSTGFRILFSDTAFGWQSTLRVGSELVHRIVSFLAAPWSWLPVSGTLVPSLEQVEGSRMILKDGILGLATDDLVSWWPFLVMCVILYGLFPRVLLYLSGSVFERRTLKRLTFDHGDCHQLLHRLIPPVATQAPPVTSEDVLKVKEVSGARVRDRRKDALSAGSEKTRVTLLIPDEIIDDMTDNNLTGLISQRLGYEIETVMGVSMDMDIDRELLESRSGLVLLQEAWQPPIHQVVDYIRELRNVSAPPAPIVVALIGKPGPDTCLTLPDPVQADVWKMKLQAVGDPYLQVTTVVTS